MLDFVESLPLPGTILVAAGISLVVTAAASRLASRRMIWLVAVVVPFATAYALYWAPFWLRHGTNRADYSAWAPVVIGIWGIPSLIACLILVFILSRRRRDDSSHV
jgi:uncharacterized protein YqgC (DUF456 family)